MSRATQSLLFSLIYSIYLVAVMGPVQWLAIRPLCALRPHRRAAIVRAWLRSNARFVLGLARGLGGMRLHIEGALPETSCIVLMNHQSLLDIPVAFSLVTGPYPLIPTRASYGRGLPGISDLMRLAGCPFVAQGPRATRAELAALTGAADAVARGERSFVIFPEGHRSRNGQIQPFMSPGLRLVFRRAPRRPVYLAAIDGLWRLTGFADIALRLAGTTARVEVRGPYAIPDDPREHDAFIRSLREEMIAMLERQRAAGAEALPLAARPRLAG